MDLRANLFTSVGWAGWPENRGECAATTRSSMRTPELWLTVRRSKDGRACCSPPRLVAFSCARRRPARARWTRPRAASLPLCRRGGRPVLRQRSAGRRARRRRRRRPSGAGRFAARRRPAGARGRRAAGPGDRFLDAQPGPGRRRGPGRRDYIGFGPVFGTRSKLNPDPTVGLEALAAVCRAVRRSGRRDRRHHPGGGAGRRARRRVRRRDHRRDRRRARSHRRRPRGRRRALQAGVASSRRGGKKGKNRRQPRDGRCRLTRRVRRDGRGSGVRRVRRTPSPSAA